MAYSNRIISETLTAAADLSTHQFKIVELSATEGEGGLAAAGQFYGVLQNHPQSGEAMTVAVEGETKVIAGAALTYGDYITTKSGGWVIPVNSGDAPPLIIGGRVKLGASSGGIATVAIDKMLATNVVSGSIAAALP